MWRALFWWRPPCLARRVVINLKDDHDVALRGVLAHSRGAWLSLVGVDALRVAGPAMRVDGEVVVHRTNVAFIQVLTDGDHS
jgi:esterase/lipase superfamily enzyme